MHPKYFIPMHGYHYMLRVHADVERKMGTPESNILIPDNGSVIEIVDDGKNMIMLRDKVDTEMIVVDGQNVGKIQDVVMRDRETLGAQGIFVMIAIIDTHLHKLKKSPDIASRGFVYSKESQTLMLEARDTIKNTVDAYLEKNKTIDTDNIKETLQSVVSKFLLQKTAKEPVVISVIITI
jgi:ribonuclease J